jgi:hypothetical protein
MGPDKILSLRLRTRRFSNAMSDSGITPCSWFSERSSKRRPVKIEIIAGSLPSNLFPFAKKM